MDKEEEKPAQSKRDILSARLKSKHPEGEWADDEALYGQIDADYDDYEGQLSRYKEQDDKLAQMYTSDPRSARLMNEWRNGGDPVVLLVKLYGKDISEAVNDPDKQEAIAEANKEFMARAAKEQDYEEEYQRNLEQTLSVIEQLQQSRGLSDDEVDGAMELLINIAKDAMLGKFSEQTIDMALKAINHDRDVATASEEGEIAGRNAKITETLRKRKEGDGTMPLAGTNNHAAAPAEGEMDVFNVAQYAS